jgi:hypothetical protein
MTQKRRTKSELAKRDKAAARIKAGIKRLVPEYDERPGVAALLRAIRAALPDLRKMLDEYSGHWAYEDPVYRFYHGSFKVYGLQESTEKIVAALKALAPDRELNNWFMEIVKHGTGRTFVMEHNQRWVQQTAPIVEAFMHARYFLEMCVRYGTELEKPLTLLPSGWAAILHLYRLR